MGTDMGDDNNNYRLKRGSGVPNEKGQIESVIERVKKIKQYKPPGFEKYSTDETQTQIMAISENSSTNLCCCDSVCACHAVDENSCECHEVCSCHDVCSCDSECSCDSDSCSCVSDSGGTYYYSTYYTYTYQTYYVYY